MKEINERKYNCAKEALEQNFRLCGQQKRRATEKEIMEIYLDKKKMDDLLRENWQLIKTMPPSLD